MITRLAAGYSTPVADSGSDSQFAVFRSNYHM
jgi:hypothetical protein